jgi:dTDP-4-amino-4,6-dideoxygalactose transaminase
MEKIIKFNWPYSTGKELGYIDEAIKNRSLSGNGAFTKYCQDFFHNQFGFKKSLLTTSCTDALEMAAILANIKPGDEVIVPSYTFVSTALAFVRQGAKIVFADSRIDHPGIDEDKIQELITKKTKAIVPVHYAGVACDMDKVNELAKNYNLLVIEDAAQAISSNYKGNPLGGIGDLGTFSFHETKNISCGEGGLLSVNNKQFEKRAEIIWEKGTNRAEFFRGEVNKYGWVDIGSSFLLSEILAAFLKAQIDDIDFIQTQRLNVWKRYWSNFSNLNLNSDLVRLPFIPPYATNNAHMFYIICRDLQFRTGLINFLKENKVSAVFHYLSLHKSPYYHSHYEGEKLENSDFYTDRLLRLPLYVGLKDTEIDYITNLIAEYASKY